ncbi:DNA ligase [bioreactor metagenome]|uniref:DNA ligase n=1 Tax=bioreactor metagenome TaxID=1076179 RepID=A0A645DC78_9ZZZZ
MLHLSSRLRPFVRFVLFALCLLVQTGCLSTAQAEVPFEPALANNYREGLALEQYWVSEKYDGVRALWDGQRLSSRQGLPIAAPAWFTKGWPRITMDGELWAGRGQFDTAQSTVAQLMPSDEEWRKLRYMVFDSPAAQGPFSQRLTQLRAAVSSGTGKHLQIVPQRRATTHAELIELLNRITHEGAEGLMLRREEGPYQGGRSDDLLKLKRFEDAEATVIAHLPGKGKYVGMTGALRVQTVAGLQFQIGSGLSDEQRRHPPPIGSTVTYRYNGLHPSGKPRFARFWRVRNEDQ